jgi:hypothetical protein
VSGTPPVGSCNFDVSKAGQSRAMQQSCIIMMTSSLSKPAQWAPSRRWNLSRGIMMPKPSPFLGGRRNGRATPPLRRCPPHCHCHCGPSLRLGQWGEPLRTSNAQTRKSPIPGPVAAAPIMMIPDSESDSAGIGNREPPASRFGRKRETARPRLAANHDRELGGALPFEYGTECTLAGTILHGLPVDVALSPSNADSQAASHGGLPRPRVVKAL